MSDDRTPLSKRQQELLLRAASAPEHRLTVTVAKEIQTGMSLRNRGLATGRFTPTKSGTFTLTPWGMVRARALSMAAASHDREIRREAHWPFPYSSRGYHLPTPLPGAK